MKVIKKRIIVFILCFTLFTCGFVHSDPVKEVKASVTVAAVSLILLGLTALGVSYYTTAGSQALSNDIDEFASANNTTSATYLNAFQSVVVDAGKNAIKYTAAQVQILKEFVTHLRTKNKVSYEPITVASFDTVPLMGYPCLLHLTKPSQFTCYSNYDNSYVTFKAEGNNNFDVYLGFGANRAINNDATHNNGSITSLHMYSFSGNYFPQLSYSVNGNSFSPISWDSNNHTANYYYRGTSLPISGYKTNLMGNSGWLNYKLNNNIFTNLFFYYPLDTGHNNANFQNAFKLRFGYVSSSDTYTGLSLPSYSVNMDVVSNIASDKDLVITSPDLIDKAVDNAKVRNPSATSITVDDVAAAIDTTAVGVINPAAEDEEDKVIAPPITLDDDLSITQDNAITDTVVEDLEITEPLPPDPPPVDPPIIDIALAEKFPFSIFTDFILIMSIFDEEPQAPVFNLGFTALGRDFQFTIDLSVFDSVASVVRTMELLAFIVGIIFVTIKFMQGGSD